MTTSDSESDSSEPATGSESDGTVAVPSKKRKVASPIRRSGRAGKGILVGGATEQLKKFGAAVAGSGQRKRHDPFDADEAANPMAPGSESEIRKHRTKRVSPFENFTRLPTTTMTASELRVSTSTRPDSQEH